MTVIAVRSVLKSVLRQCRSPLRAIETDAALLAVAIDNAPANDRYDLVALTPGRSPEGFEPPALTSWADPVGAWYARAALFERASIFAFEHLADELASHGAPKSLVRRALESADDERMHDAMMASLALRRGVDVPDLDPPPRAPRPLSALALENMTEGCVRETWSALIACWQAARCADPDAQEAFRVIADDETRHAQLAWDVAAWIAPRLDELSTARVRRGCDVAVDEVGQEALAEIDPALVVFAGLPSSIDAMGLLAELDAQLWSRL
jgi:hypothetical protein